MQAKKSNQTPQKKKEYDNTYNEGAEGYNPYR